MCIIRKGWTEECGAGERVVAPWTQGRLGPGITGDGEARRSEGDLGRGAYRTR